MTDLPERPDFTALEAIASEAAGRRSELMTLIGNLVLSWSNNESMFIYVLMLLLRTDETSAATVFVTLNTTRARLELVQRLAKVHVRDAAMSRRIASILKRFNEANRIRNEYNHSMYALDEHGAITHTRLLRFLEKRNRLELGHTQPVDDARLQELRDTLTELKELNRALWDLLPDLKAHLAR